MPRIDLTREVPQDLWTTPYVSAGAVDAGQIDPALINSLTNQKNLTRIASNAWQTSTQLAFKNLAVSVGIEQKYVASVRELVQGISPIAATGAGQLAAELAASGVGVATSLLGSIPIVGAVAKAVVGVVRMLIGLQKKQKEGYRVAEQLPQLQRWEETVDQDAVNGVLRRLTEEDWTDVLMPAYGGSWSLKEAHSGWYAIGDVQLPGWGFMPGTQQCARVAQAAFQQVAEAGAMRDELIPIAQNTGSFFPGVGNLGVVLDQQIQKPQAQMYTVDTIAIDRAWLEYFSGLRSIASRVFHGQVKVEGFSKFDTENRRYQVASSLITPMLVKGGRIGGSLGGWQPRNTDVNPWKKYIHPWCERLRKRQFRYTKTLVVAYASINAGAVSRNPILKEQFVEMRKLLLTHPARMKVNLDDVLDDDYRAALLESRRDWRPDAFQAAPQRVFDAIPQGSDGAVGPGGGAPFDGDAATGSKLFWLAVLAVGGAFAWKRYKK